MKKYLFIAILIIGFLTGLFFWPKGSNSKEKILFCIEKGQGSKEISVSLQEQDLIRLSPAFKIYVIMRGVADNLQAGCYFLSPSMNIPEIAGIFTSGHIAQAKITIPEGFSSKQIYQRFQELNLSGFGLDKLAEHEGYLFPDTYEIPYGLEQEKVVEIMRNNFNKKTAGLEITNETVIMASILEKEVQTKEDKKIVSGIFWKRLKTQRPLESCATIAYIKGVDQWRYSYEDTRIESSYNTYLHLGLPPGPISNPGLESMEAALHPETSPYWYYLSTPEGKTIFSKTLEEHNAAKARYLK